MPAEKLTVSWDEISSPKVDDRLKLLDSAAAAVNNRRFARSERRRPEAAGSLLYNAIVYMSFFGLLGGLLGWGISEPLNFRASAAQEAREAMNTRREIEAVIASGDMSAEQGKGALQVVDEENAGNPIITSSRSQHRNFRPSSASAQEAEYESRDQWKDFLTDLLFYGVSGMTIAVCLGIAEPVTERNWRGVVVNGSVAAILGVVGGVVVSLFINRFRVMIVSVIADAQTPMIKTMIANAVQWGTLGLFLGVASGIVLKSAKKSAAGATGGLIGGLIGGALYDPVAQFSHNQHIARLVAICVIGLVAGLGTGLIENAVKTGWLKVSAGLIAGKQFILYRDPTYIGSALSCHIYLFRDPAVGKRHAAVHIVPGGFEIENLPLGSGTLVNHEQVVGRRTTAQQRSESRSAQRR